jgi:hypothetical protein
MKIGRRLAAAIAVPVLVAGAGLAAAASASASVGPVQYTPAGADSISGYYAHAENDSINFTHLASRVGGDGQHSIEQLPVSSVTGTVSIGGAAGIGLCNQGTGQAAQIGLVYVGGGLMDVVDATGYLAAGNNSDLCQGGIVNPSGLNSASGFSFTHEVTDLSYTAGSPNLTVTSGPTPPLGAVVTVVIPGGAIPAGGVMLSPTFTIHPSPSNQTFHFTVVKSGVTTFELGTSANVNSVLTVPAGTPQPPAGTVPSVSWLKAAHTPGATFDVLKAGIPDNNSVDLDILYDAANPHPTFHGHVYAQGTIIFSATDLGAPGVSYQNGVSIPGKTFNEADAGAIADTQTVIPLSGTPPYPYNGHNTDPSELEGFSHTLADGNSVLPGGTETHGTFYSNPAWTAFPVASDANGKTYLGPTQFVNDGFLELVGAPVS